MSSTLSREDFQREADRRISEFGENSRLLVLPLALTVLGGALSMVSGSFLYFALAAVGVLAWMEFGTANRYRAASEKRTAARLFKEDSPLTLPAWTLTDERFKGVDLLSQANLTPPQVECAAALAADFEGTVDELLEAVKPLA